MVNFVRKKESKEGVKEKKRKTERKKRKEERNEVMKKETKENKRNPLSHKGHHFLFFLICGDHFTAYVYIKSKHQVTYIKCIQL